MKNKERYIKKMLRKINEALKEAQEIKQILKTLKK